MIHMKHINIRQSSRFNLLFTFICILYGIVKIGLAFFSEEFHKIKKRETFPQALSIMAVLVILMMFAFSMQLMSIAPNEFSARRFVTGSCFGIVVPSSPIDKK